MNCTTEKTYKAVKNLLANGYSNAKTAKNDRETVILYLSPSTQNSKGINLCPKASAGCLAACLYTAGRGAFNSTQLSRLNKTEYYIQDRFLFLEQTAKEINKAAKKAAKKGGELAVRLNGTSDIKLVETVTQMYEIDSNVVFYDYTKIKQKAGRRVLPSGHKYTVTFSRSEDNESDAIEVLNDGGIVAMVFAGELPTEYKGFKVYDGDSRDDIMLDIEGAAILGLKAKGSARKDKSGFVITDY